MLAAPFCYVPGNRLPMCIVLFDWRPGAATPLSVAASRGSLKVYCIKYKF